MRRFFRMAGIGIAIVLVLAQLIRPDLHNPPVESDVPAPAPVREALRNACYDCHSNETAWPWYARVAPLSWLLAYDVREGRSELNFSTWQRYDAQQRRKRLQETIETLSDGEMPPWYYRIVHRESRLAETDRAALVDWARATASNPGPTQLPLSP